MAKAVRRSPILGAVTSMISAESERLITQTTTFRHSFELDIDRATPDPLQARKQFNDIDIAALAETMASQGQLQPILVRRSRVDDREIWFIVAGERRWRAAKMNGWLTILAIEHTGDTEVIGLIENLQRVDLSPVEEALALQRLITGRHWPQERAAQALGKTKGDISSTLRILTLPADLLAKVLTSELTVPKNTLIELARVEDPVAQARLIALAMAGQLTIRSVRDERERAVVGPLPSPVGTKEPERSPERIDGSASRIAGMLRHLTRLQQKGGVLTPDDQALLRELRAVIDAVLGE